MGDPGTNHGHRTWPQSTENTAGTGRHPGGVPGGGGFPTLLELPQQIQRSDGGDLSHVCGEKYK